MKSAQTAPRTYIKCCHISQIRYKNNDLKIRTHISNTRLSISAAATIVIRLSKRVELLKIQNRRCKAKK
ncbi:hypothetical protein T4B_7699 [Trichinella pseudospiralis]|uniref:Uncharacterized protein n=2 Tax=Trichinella pseudospiralis TaxID=6337 RepID=A0A0V1J559_TRIPS|nr:hypothetical protein T4D_3404 [Trichinella pseudospiralis]KRZ30098.1 hypothetical protein T4B_7699 [Trichinella pseudospiralis]KRZ40044.1 hypothetical protein T4C_11110 [Trichinella pseudospiralis]